MTRGPKAVLRAREYHQPPLLEYRLVKNMVEDNMYTCFNQGSSNIVQRLHQGKVEKG